MKIIVFQFQVKWNQSYYWAQRSDTDDFIFLSDKCSSRPRLRMLSINKITVLSMFRVHHFTLELDHPDWREDVVSAGTFFMFSCNACLQ